MSRTVNPFYAARNQCHAVTPRPARPSATEPHVPAGVDCVTIGNATLYRGDCFEVLPQLAGVDAVVTDPPYGIGFAYRSYDDAPSQYDALMQRLVPELVRVTHDGPCFVWQSMLKADQWHRYFPSGYRIVAACKSYPDRDGKRTCLSWDPVIFWSGRSRISEELPRDWHHADLRSWDGYRGGNPVPCPRPVSQVAYFCQHVRAETILDPFMGSGTTGVASILAGKRFVGIERDPVYFAYACERIRKVCDDVARQRGTLTSARAA